jgi:hypothetical protein
MRSPMRRRSLAWGLAGVVVVAVLGACASLSGLDQYSGDGCQDCAGPGDATGGGDVLGADDRTSNDTGSPVPEEDVSQPPGDAPAYVPSDAPPMEYPDVFDGMAGDAEGGGPPLDAGSGDADGGGARDAGEAGPPVDAGSHDAAVDAAPDAPSCTAASCNGCCTSAGLCAGGGLSSACGTGGASCQTCSGGTVCGSAGSCITPPVDAGDSGPPGCKPTTCSNLCVPYFIQCCKADQSCGCALLFPPGQCQ